MSFLASKYDFDAAVAATIDGKPLVINFTGYDDKLGPKMHIESI